MKSFAHDIGSIFQPIYDLLGRILAFFYGIIPNYAIAIALLTVVIMGVLTPFTIKSTKSMISMQKLQPELKKLQQKYKGPENRQLLNEEMMRLYKEEGVNPLGGCLPMLLQTPFLIMLYGVIKGLANKVMLHGKLVSLPRYIPSSSKMYRDLVHSGGQIKAFGMDLNLKLFSVHSSFLAQIPFIAFVLAAVGLQYFQMAQIEQPQPQDRPGDACAAIGDAALLAAYFCILLHDYSRSCGVVHDYFNIYPYINSTPHVHHRCVGPHQTRRETVDASRRDRRGTQGRSESTSRRRDPGCRSFERQEAEHASQETGPE